MKGIVLLAVVIAILPGCIKNEYILVQNKLFMSYISIKNGTQYDTISNANELPLSVVKESLDFENIRNGFDGLQIRVWFDYGLSTSAQVLILRNFNSRWSAKYILLKYNLNTKRDSIISVEKNIVDKNPKSSWKYFADSLLALHVLELHDYRYFLPTYDVASDADRVIVEIGTEKKYRNYSFYSPSLNKTIIDAKNLCEIVNLIKTEFDLKGIKRL